MEQLIKDLKVLKGGRSTTQFALDLGIPPSSLSRIFSGRRGIGNRMLEKILAHYPQLASSLVQRPSERGA